ncbi:hypothetical protein L1987_42519 [Smallanthus sonchifolius]|uniref:Uncharacterized protein n=1 Tax=Smallanthus sonchifolius TaxID=185202 RepID=A0ACB9GJ58_9ASTR|nr:hypothetical protein L1987_42519 [Smallanthus sonchifolius]
MEIVLHLPSSETVGMHFKVPNGLFSTNTTYGCYLVYKMPQDFARETKVKMKLDDDDDDDNLTYLSISQSPRPDAVESSSSPMNKHKTIQLPRKRKDGWLEVNLGNKTDVQWMNMRYGEQFDHLWRSELGCISGPRL